MENILLLRNFYKMVLQIENSSFSNIQMAHLTHHRS